MPLAMDTHAVVTDNERCRTPVSKSLSMGYDDTRPSIVVLGSFQDIKIDGGKYRRRTGQRTSVGRSELWRDLRNHAVYGEAHDVHPNRPVRGRRLVALRQQLRSHVIKEDGVSSLSVTSGSGVPVFDDKIDPRGVLVAGERSTYDAVDQSQAPQSVLSEAVPPTNEIASSNGRNKKRTFVVLAFVPIPKMQALVLSRQVFLKVKFVSSVKIQLIMLLNKVWHLRSVLEPSGIQQQFQGRNVRRRMVYSSDVCGAMVFLVPKIHTLVLSRRVLLKVKHPKFSSLTPTAVNRWRSAICYEPVQKTTIHEELLLGQFLRKITATGHSILIWATVINDVTIVVVYSSMVNGLKDNHTRCGQSIIYTVEEIDESVNIGRGPYVFKVSRQIYHWIGSLCPEEGHQLCFLQLYIYDATNEVINGMRHFGGADDESLDAQIVERLIHILDEHNKLVQLFRTTRDECRDASVTDFKIWLYNMGGVRGYELPTSQGLGDTWHNIPNLPLPIDQILFAECLSRKFTTQMELSTIAQLTPSSTNKTLEAKVYRKWIVNPPQN
nr:hypothetical protein [Tanacetum cinerariifolium]